MTYGKVITPASDTGGTSASPGRDRAEMACAVAAFAVLCVVVLTAAPFLVEPDDYAYRASIVALTQGHFLTLTTAQVHALGAQLAGGHWGQPGRALPPIAQWVRLPDGRWISEKDPGYPFLAAPFQALGVIRLAPLCYGALGCLGLFAGARRWLGRPGGAAAVGLFCSSGAALLFAWRDYMPTFTDASLIAAGTGALLWAVLATDMTPRRRTWAGLAAFAALEAAVFARYTDIVVLGCAVVAVLVAWRLKMIPAAMLGCWLGLVALFAAGVAGFDDLVYGGPLSSGYRPGEITFSLGAVPANLRFMPAHLIEAMPLLVPGLAALAWIIVRQVRLRRPSPDQASPDQAGPEQAGPEQAGPEQAGPEQASTGRAGPEQARTGRAGPDRAAPARRDLAVGLALAASWWGVWGLYAAYTWTAGPGLSTLQAARFYVPALGAMALLGAWLVVRVPPRGSLAALTSAAVVAVMFGLGVWAFGAMRDQPFPGQRHGGGPPGRVARAARPAAAVAVLPGPGVPYAIVGRGTAGSRPVS